MAFIINEIVFFALLFGLGYLLKVTIKKKRPGTGVIASASSLIVASYFLIDFTSVLTGDDGIGFPIFIDFQWDIFKARYDYDLGNLFFVVVFLYFVNIAVAIVSLMKVGRAFIKAMRRAG